MDRVYLKSKAKEDLQGKWKIFSLAYLLYILIGFAGSIPNIFSLCADLTDLVLNQGVLNIQLPEFITKIGNGYSNSGLTFFGDFADLILTVLISAPLFYAVNFISLKVTEKEEISVADIFSGFKNFKKVVSLYIVEYIYVALWSLLFIIPGIMKSFSYAMANYVLAENPDISASDALSESERLMKGHRLEFFVLQISFIGWHLLNFVTLGLLTLYSSPYIFTTEAEFYQYLKTQNSVNAKFCDEDEENYIECTDEYITYQSDSENEIFAQLPEEITEE